MKEGFSLRKKLGWLPLVAIMELFVWQGFAEKVDVEELLHRVQFYQEGGTQREARALERWVESCASDPEQAATTASALCQLFEREGTSKDAKRLILRQLLWIATSEQVPLLTRLLSEEEWANEALQVLAVLPGEEATKALGESLEHLEGPLLLGAIDALGGRSQPVSVERLSSVIHHEEKRVRVAALSSLARTGTLEACGFLVHLEEIPSGLEEKRAEALLFVADRIVSKGGPRDMAKMVYRKVWESAASDRARATALVGLFHSVRYWEQYFLSFWEDKSGSDEGRMDSLVKLVRYAHEKESLLSEALDSESDRVRQKAVLLTEEVPSRNITRALVETWSDAKNAQIEERCLILEALGKRDDERTSGVLEEALAEKDPRLRLAAISALGDLSGPRAVRPLLQTAVQGERREKEASRQALSRLVGEGVEKELAILSQEGDPTMRVEAILCMAARGMRHKEELFLKIASEDEGAPREAALEALDSIGTKRSYEPLLFLLLDASDKREVKRIEETLLAVGRELLPERRVQLLLPALKKAKGELQLSLVRLAASCGERKALEALRELLKRSEEPLRSEAIRCLSRWQNAEPLADLIQIATVSESEAERALALTGTLRLLREGRVNEGERISALRQIRSQIETPQSKGMLLAALGGIGEKAALELALPFLEDEEAKKEAAAAILSICEKLGPSCVFDVLFATERILDRRLSQDAMARALNCHKKALLSYPTVHGPSAVEILCHDQERSRQRKEAVQAKLEGDDRVIGYLDCGRDTEDRDGAGVSLELVSGDPYVWDGGSKPTDPAVTTIVFGGGHVAFHGRGFKKDRSYRLGWRWLDYDHDSRRQSIWVKGKGGTASVEILEPTRLPAKSQGPAELTVELPNKVTGTGETQIEFRNEGSPNVVLSELWLIETAKREDQAAPVQPSELTLSSRPVQVLLVTGQDLHDWRATTPLLKKLLEEDPRLGVTVVEDPAFLSSSKIHEFDVMVHHWMDWQVDPPGEEAREQYKRFVSQGKGVVLVHFACGAFQDWPEFVEIAGRVWDPKLRPHDPRGPFQVEIVDKSHPITEGLADFQTDDELYTCLAGDKPIHLLAQATSKVDGKAYPIAFFHQYGQGNVFHCVLGHDSKAFRPEGVKTFFRRGCAWAAGIPVQP